MQLALHNPYTYFCSSSKAGQCLTDTTGANSQSMVITDASLRFLFACTRLNLPTYHTVLLLQLLLPGTISTSLKCTKHVTDSGSICGGCSINYVQLIKLHLFLKGLSAPDVLHLLINS